MINYNGKIYPANKSIITVGNRAFRYGDSLYETIRMFDGKMPFIGLHWQRLKAGMEVLKIDIPENYSQLFFEKEINKITGWNGPDNFRIRLMVFRSGGGLYTPENNAPVYFIEASPLDSGEFEWNKAGLKTGICEDVELRATLFSKYKTGSALPFIMAGIYKKENDLDDCLLLNQAHSLACGSSANIFLWRKNELFTPPLSGGCVAGTMRWVVINLAKKLNINIVEKEINKKELPAFDEMFLTNAIQGIRWVEKVAGFEKKFIHEKTYALYEALNHHLTKIKVRA